MKLIWMWGAPSLAIILTLTSTSLHAFAASNAAIQVTEHKLSHADEPEKASSTLAGLQFDVSIFDPNAQFALAGGTDVFSAAENTEKEMDEGKKRKQNLFFTIINAESGKAAQSILFETGTIGRSFQSNTLLFTVIVPFSKEERVARIKEGVKGAPKEARQHFGGIDPVKAFDAWHVQESKPGRYVLRVTYLTTTGERINSNDLPFTIRDKGNLYSSWLRTPLRRD
jgi:hypothetical protein